MPICVAGMHRAGTSLVARLLEGAGLDLGGAAHFAPPAADNRDGYWEDLRFVALNDRLLDRLGGAWDTPPALPAGWEDRAAIEAVRQEARALVAARTEPWGWKDPRTSLTLAFWKRLLPDLKVVVCVRNPLEVSDSLRARGYTSERFGLALWEAYHRVLDEAVDPSFSVVTHYESVLADPGAELDRLLAFTGLTASPAVRQAILAGAKPGARHQRRTSAQVESSGLAESGKRLYASLCARSGPVYAEARRREAQEPAVPPAGPPAPERRSPEDQLREVSAVLAARDEELASMRPVLVARKEEVDSLKHVLKARDAEIASVLPLLAAREAELANAHAYLASLQAALADSARALDAAAARDRRLRTLSGIAGLILAAVKRRLTGSA